MNHKLRYTFLFFFLLIGLQAFSQELIIHNEEDPIEVKLDFTLLHDEQAHSEETHEGFDVTELILEHLADTYDWHIATFGHTHISIPLPVIVKKNAGGWYIFSSARFEHGHAEYEGFYIAEHGDYKGKIVERNASGHETRPWDISLTKNACSLLISSTLLIFIILMCTNWYRKRQGRPNEISPKGFVALIEMLITSIIDSVIKPCVGKNYRSFVPYLLTVFFFIFLNNLMGLIPIFPGGANVTGNIAVTCVLAIFTFVIINIFGTKEYWKEILWPEVPLWLKAPIPIMPAIELVGVFTKPFALMIRLFANILAGHSIVLGLTCMIFLTVSLGPALNAGMSFLAILMAVFISFIELLVAFIQAYVFTMLSAVFIGLAQVEPHHS